MSDDIVYITTHAEEILTNILWPDGPTCPECGSHEFSRLKDGRYYCKKCKKHYSIKTGTLFQKSRTPLSKWLIALYLMLVNNGLSSCSMARYLGNTQTTAYNMMLKLRFLFNQEDTQLEGENIAIDEVYFGGSWSKFTLEKKLYLLDKFKLPKCPKTVKEKLSVANKVNSLYKQPILGINSGDKVVLSVMPKSYHQPDVVDIYKSHVNEGNHAVSDCSKLYDNWKELTGCDISHNNHSKLQFKASDGRSSNPVEGTFSQHKRQTLNLHCHLSTRLLQLYLNEFCFRFNTRTMSILERLAEALRNVRQIVTGSVLAKYDSLKGKSNEPEIFDPFEFFKSCGDVINQVVRDNVVYRREEFMTA